MYRLIALDMDGTLLDSQKQVSERTLRAIKKAAEQGKILVYCTGRAPIELTDFREQMPEIQYAICNNGASLWDMHKWEMTDGSELATELIARILKASEKEEHLLQLYSGAAVIYDEYTEEKVVRGGLAEYIPLYRRIVKTISGYEEYFVNSYDPETAAGGDCEYEKIPVNKFSLHLTGVAPRERLKKKLDRLNLPVEIRRSNRYSLEVTAKGVSKASGLRMVCTRLGMELSETIAVGDGGNDLDVMKIAGFGIAVGNAAEEVKKIAGAIVADNDHDGCAEAIEKYLLG